MTRAEGIPRRVLLVSTPRTASNLLLQMLNIHAQPNALTNERGGYFFYPYFLHITATGLCDKPVGQWSDEEKQTTTSTFQSSIHNIETYSKQAEHENKILFAKEHSFWFAHPASLQKLKVGIDDDEFTRDFRSGIRIPERYGPTQTYSSSNKTVLSDEYLRTWQMAFIIRHPALAWPSLYRAVLKIADELGMTEAQFQSATSVRNMTFHWARSLFDWCMEQPGTPTPVVVDAHDLIHTPEIVLKFCERLGMDHDTVRFKWSRNDDQNPGSAVNIAKIEQSRHERLAPIMLSTLNGSAGVIKDKAPGCIDISAEAAKWSMEFGEEAARSLEKAVVDSMPDYEFLRSHRITV